jgi:transposase-like protein
MTDAGRAKAITAVLPGTAWQLPAAAAHLDAARDDILAFTAFPGKIWRQIWSNNPLSAWLNKEICRRPGWSASSPVSYLSPQGF